MLGSARKTPERLKAFDRVQEWTRERFRLAPDAAIHVWELACAVPGCPPAETVVTFWMAERRYQFKVFKPVGEVVCEDLPPEWYKDALALAEGFDCDCC